MVGRHHRSPMITASVESPTASVAVSISSSRVTNSQTRANGLSASIVTPVKALIWLVSSVMPTPVM